MGKFYTYILILGVFCTASLNAQNALDFDGNDDKVDCGNDTSVRITGTQITLEAWIYPTAWKKNVYENDVIIKEDNTNNYGYMLRVGESGRMNFAFGDGSWHELNSTGYVLSLNTWQHIAGTYDGNKMRIYVNGVCVDSLSVSATIKNASNTNLLLGAHATYARNYQGKMDEVRIWNICLSDATINANMNRELCDRPSGLMAYYKFNQGKQAQANTNVKKLNDLGPYRNHGNLSGFTLNGGNSNWVSGVVLSKDVVNFSDTVSACARYTSPSKRYTWIKSGVYYDTLPTVVMGCDSAITVNLTIRKVSSNQIKAHACSAYLSPSGKYTWTKSGVYTDYLKNYQQCDSIITITLEVGSSRDSIYPDVCNAYMSPKGRTLTVSGEYSDTLVNYRNCDSIVDIFLKVRKSSNANISRAVCITMVSPSLKYVYTSNGVYTDTIKNQQGCDSIIRISLKILNSSSSISRTVCGSMLSPSGKYIWTSTGQYKDTISNKAFCDSVISVNLIVNPVNSFSMNAASCGPYVSPSKKYIWNNSGTYKDTLDNYAGCDSLITVNLTVTKVNAGVIQNNATLTALNNNSNVGFVWLDCKNAMSPIPGANAKVYTATKNGEYAVQVTENNCMDTSDCYTVSGLSLSNNQSENRIVISPNPGNGTYTLRSTGTAENMTVRIRDISGRLIFEAYYEQLTLEQIELSAGDGIYLIEFSSADSYRVEYLVLKR